jgi:hypothetical protein
MVANMAPCYAGQNLDFGQTVPLTHAPVQIHQVTGQFSNGNQAYFNNNQSIGLNHTQVAPIVVPHPTNCLRNATTHSQKKAVQSEKKRWQTADFRWMFTKRKGNTQKKK